MQLIIDTEKDSKEDIRKAVAFLSSLADGKTEHHSNIFEDSSPTLGESSEPEGGTNAFSAMFGDDKTPILGASSSEDNNETPILESSSQEESSEEKTEDEEPQMVEY